MTNVGGLVAPERILSDNLSHDPQSAQGQKNTPQHGVLFGMTGAGKSVIVADLLAQMGDTVNSNL